MSNAKPTPPVFEPDAAQASLICPPDVPGGFLTRGALIAGIVLISVLFILPRAFPAADHWIGVQIALGTGFLLVLLYGVWCVHSGGRLHRRHGVANPLAADAGGDGGYGAGVGAAASADESAGLSEGVRLVPVRVSAWPHGRWHLSCGVHGRAVGWLAAMRWVPRWPWWHWPC